MSDVIDKYEYHARLRAFGQESKMAISALGCIARRLEKERDELQTQFDTAMQVIEENNLMTRFEELLG